MSKDVGFSIPVMFQNSHTFSSLEVKKEFFKHNYRNLVWLIMSERSQTRPLTKSTKTVLHSKGYPMFLTHMTCVLFLKAP